MVIVRAGYILTPSFEAIEDVSLLVDQGKILAVGSFEELCSQYLLANVFDLPDAILIPGLINAHTHFDLSSLRGQVAYNGDFIDWVRRLSALRQEQDSDLQSVIEDACQESVRSGTTTVGDISFQNLSSAVLAGQTIRKTCYAEVFGMPADLTLPKDYLAECISTLNNSELMRWGISPHAPYSVNQSLYEYCSELAVEYDLPLMTHLSETQDEIEFIQNGGGPWKSYLEEIDKWDGSYVASGKSPVNYFLSMKLHNRPVALAHVNYLSDVDLSALAKTEHSVVYCPRAHAFLGHENYPLARLLEKDIHVCLGTDSLASNDSLSILDEMRFVHQVYPEIAAGQIFKMATLHGAKALHWEKEVGVIEIGMEADLVALPLAEGCQDPLVDVLESDVQPSVVMVRGEIVHQAE